MRHGLLVNLFNFDWNWLYNINDVPKVGLENGISRRNLTVRAS